jgi:hypothetical protein
MKKEIEVQVKADREVLALTGKLLQTQDIESRYRIFLETLGNRTADQVPLCFYCNEADGSVMMILFELKSAGFLQYQQFSAEQVARRSDGFAVGGITYAGRLELARLIREKEAREQHAREQVWWRKYRRGIGRALLVIIPAAWTVITVLIDIFRDSIRAWLSGLFGW